jgi:RimJ/RimL family protein N-acetyltransferase
MPEVRIRPYRIDDGQAIVDAVHESLAELMPWMPWAHPAYSIHESQQWLDVQIAAFERATAFEFAIVGAAGNYLGGCGLNQLDAANRRANLGYWVRSNATRRGAATAAVCLLREWAFRSTDLVRLEILVAVGNAASLRVAAKSGAVREGVLRSRLLLHEVVHDATMFSFVRPGRLTASAEATAVEKPVPTEAGPIPGKGTHG